MKSEARRERNERPRPEHGREVQRLRRLLFANDERERRGEPVDTGDWTIWP